MNSQEKRRLYRVLMKYMALLAVLVLFVVLVRSVFYRVPEAITLPTITVNVDVEPMSLQLVRWNDQDIAILRLTTSHQPLLENVTVKGDSEYIDKKTRSSQANYFIFQSRGSGAGCPINITRSQGLWQLRDICTQIAYDLSGRPLKKQSSVLALTIPPHYWQDESTLVIGAWKPTHP